MSSSLDRREPAKYILLEVKSDAFIIIHIFINILYQKFFSIYFIVCFITFWYYSYED